jgi:hypothetical protein
VKAKLFFVAVNAQFKAAPLNSQALGKYINKVDQVDQLNREIEKYARGGQRLWRDF